MSVATRSIPHKEKYGKYINQATCGETVQMMTREGSPDMFTLINFCRSWCCLVCAAWLKSQWMPKLLMSLEERHLATLWCGDEQDANLGGLINCLVRYGLGGWTIRDNGGLWVFIRGDLDRRLLDRTARRYGFTEVRLTDTGLIGQLDMALSVEQSPLNKRRKVQSWGDCRGRGIPQPTDDLALDQSQSCPSDSTPVAVLESEPKQQAAGGEVPEPLGRWITFTILVSEWRRWHQEMAQDSRYAIEDRWQGKGKHYQWKGQGPRPSWRVPGVISRGL